MMSTIVLQPIFLEHLLGYPASTAGLVMAPRGIAVAVGMASVAVLINRIEPRVLVLAGLTLSAAGSYAMTWYNLDIDLKWIILPGIVQGIGMGMIFVPLSTLAYQTLPPAATDQAASIFNLARTIGGSIGIAISATVLTRDSQASWSILGARINPYDPALAQWLETTGIERLRSHHGCRSRPGDHAAGDDARLPERVSFRGLGLPCAHSVRAAAERKDAWRGAR